MRIHRQAEVEAGIHHPAEVEAGNHRPAEAEAGSRHLAAGIHHPAVGLEAEAVDHSWCAIPFEDSGCTIWLRCLGCFIGGGSDVRRRSA